MKTINLKIYGIDCIACVTNVENILNDIDGIASAKVNYSTSDAYIELDKDINLDSLSKKLNKYGFSIPIQVYKIKTNSVNEVINTLNRCFGIKELKINDSIIEVNMYSICNDFSVLKKYLSDYDYEILDFDNGSEELEINNQLVMLKRLLESVVLTTPIFWSVAPIIQLILTTLLLIFPGRYFYKGFYRSIKSKQLNMDFLIALSTTIIYLYSAYLTFTVFEDIQLYFLCDGVLLSLVLFGKYLEIITKGETSKSLKALFHLIPDKTLKLVDDDYKEVYVDNLKVDDVLKVLNGQRFPVDSILLSENTFVDESLITGESRLIQKKRNDHLIGGSLNRENDVLIKVVKDKQDSSLSKMIEMVKESQNAILPIQSLADKISNVFIIAVLFISIFVFSIHYFYFTSHDLSTSILTMCGVLVVACPCALGLATPTSIMVASARAMELGILYRNGIELETAAKISVVVFDKTGTLTKGDVNNDILKDEAIKVIEKLKSENIKVVILSGDKKEIVENISGKLNVDEYRYELSPAAKNDYIKKLKDNGEIVAMVGDGINDGPALASSDVSITFQNASDVAKDVSGVIILNNDLNSIPTCINLAKATMRNIYGNLLWALLYNIICIPLAAFGIMNPSIASAAMSSSSIAVLLHSLTLRKACK